jgi:predicted GIY-YIG superfamily endonuclease
MALVFVEYAYPMNTTSALTKRTVRSPKSTLTMETDSATGTDHINPLEDTAAANMAAAAVTGLSRAALHPSRCRETSTLPPTLTGKAFCCYILASDQWPTPYTGKTCDLARRLRSHNNPSLRSRAYTKGKGPWRVAAAVFGLRSNRQSVWLERALKKHAKYRARPAGLDAIQTAVLDAVHVASHPDAWWPKGQTHAARAAAASDPPALHLHIFKTVLAPRPQNRVGTPSSGSGNIVPNMLLLNKMLLAAVTSGTNNRLHVHCHRHRNYTC